MVRSVLFAGLLMFSSMFGAVAFAASDVPKEECTKAQAQQIMDIVVSIRRDFDKEEVYTDKETRKLVTGVRGSGWRIGENQIATIYHVPEAMKLSATEWKKVTISMSEAEYKPAKPIMETEARLKFVSDGDRSEERAAIIELRDPLPPQVATGQMRFAPLGPNDGAIAIGYTDGKLRIATGHLNYPKPKDTDRTKKESSSLTPYEVVDKDANKDVGDRSAIAHGASGGLIAGCKGKIAAVIAKIPTQDLTKNPNFAGMVNLMRQLQASGLGDFTEQLEALEHTSSAWGQYNLLGLSVSYFPHQ